jgi:2-polyprenyl-6-methoxyphenol hydroxylase-like FAD-dependent oxidoreductase
MAKFFDVVIAGGGPAGSTAGTLLAKHGWNVAIFEKEKFPRFKIGESLLPGSVRTFERMGVKEKIDRADVIVKHGGNRPAVREVIGFFFVMSFAANIRPLTMLNARCSTSCCWTTPRKAAVGCRRVLP